jgi:hypothetical protein
MIRWKVIHVRQAQPPLSSKRNNGKFLCVSSSFWRDFLTF